MSSKSGIIISVVAAGAIVGIPTVAGLYLADRIFGKLLPEPKMEEKTPFQKKTEEPSDGLPKSLVATGIETHLGSHFGDITKAHGMCLLDPSGKKPLRSQRIWPEELPSMGTAQAEWNIDGNLVTVLWLPPGADSPAAMVQHDSMVTFSPQEIVRLLKSEGKAAWQRKTPIKTENLYGTNPKAKTLLAEGVPGITFWRMDGASVDITPKRITFRNAKVTRMWLDHILAVDTGAAMETATRD